LYLIHLAQRVHGTFAGIEPYSKETRSYFYTLQFLLGILVRIIWQSTLKQIINCNDIIFILWKENLNSDGQWFLQYQQNGTTTSHLRPLKTKETTANGVGIPRALNSYCVIIVFIFQYADIFLMVFIMYMTGQYMNLLDQIFLLVSVS
jgi:hypothetical protein